MVEVEKGREMDGIIGERVLVLQIVVRCGVLHA